MAVTVAPADARLVAGAPMSYWRTVAWRLRRDPTTIGAEAPHLEEWIARGH